MIRFDLRFLTPEAAVATLHQAMAVSADFEVLSWRLPERNLDYPATALVRLLSFFSGWPHKAHLAAGGLEGLLVLTLLAPQSGWRVKSRSPACFGAATLLVAEKIQKKD